MTEQTLAELRSGLATLQRQCQGVWRIVCHGLDDLGPGDLAADPLLNDALFGLGHAIEAADPNDPRLCLLCDAPFSARRDLWPAAIVVMRPDMPSPQGAVVQALCDGCYGGDNTPALQAAILRAMCRYTGWSMRAVDTTSHAPGRA